MRKPRINIFDDDVTTLKLLAEIMSERDYEVLTFERAVVCPVYNYQVEVCPNQKPCADIVFTDNQMPLMTGIDMLLLQAQRGCKIDIRNKLVVSSSLDNSEQSILKSLGIAFLSKPFRLSDISAWLDDCEKRLDLSQSLAILRKGDRYPAEIDLAYATLSGDRICKGTAINISESGLCLKTDTPLRTEQSIIINTEIPNGCRQASVRWVMEKEAEGYMAGFSCC